MYTKRRVKALVGAVAVIISVALVILGQRRVGWAHLGLMVLGLAGILLMLFLYNRGQEHPAHEGLDEYQAKNAPGEGGETPR